MFSSCFTILDLKFKVLIHFKLIFVSSVREWPSFILLHMVIQFSQYYLLKRLPLSPWSILWLLRQIFYFICESLLLGSQFFLVSLCVYICMLISYCFDCYSFIVKFEIRKCDVSSFVLLFQDCFGYLDLLWFHMYSLCVDFSFLG